MIKDQFSVWSIIYKNYVYNYDNAQWHIFMWYRRIFSLVIRPMLIHCYKIYFTNRFFQKALRVLVTIWLEDISHWERSSYSMQFTWLNKHHVIRYLMLNQWTVIETLSFSFKKSQCYFQRRKSIFPYSKKVPYYPKSYHKIRFIFKIHLGTEWSGRLVIARVGVKTAWRAKVKKIIEFLKGTMGWIVLVEVYNYMFKLVFWEIM